MYTIRPHLHKCHVHIHCITSPVAIAQPTIMNCKYSYKHARAQFKSNNTRAADTVINRTLENEIGTSIPPKPLHCSLEHASAATTFNPNACVHRNLLSTTSMHGEVDYLRYLLARSSNAQISMLQLTLQIHHLECENASLRAEYWNWHLRVQTLCARSTPHT